MTTMTIAKALNTAMRRAMERDSKVLVMSERARRALKPQVFAQLSGCTDAVLAVPIPTIETLGGGSVRCMLAEVFRTA